MKTEILTNVGVGKDVRQASNEFELPVVPFVGMELCFKGWPDPRPVKSVCLYHKTDDAPKLLVETEGHDCSSDADYQQLVTNLEQNGWTVT